jgi:putative OmpL-like beta-barrel porin-2
MFGCLVLGTALTLGQAPAAPPDRPDEPIATLPAGIFLSVQPRIPAGEAKVAEPLRLADPVFTHDSFLLPAVDYSGAPPAGSTGTGGRESKGVGAPEMAAVQPPPRRALPSPFDSPPFPGSEYQGYPLIGVPPDTEVWPLMKAIQGTPYGDFLTTNKTRVYGWVTAEGNVSTSRNSNTPDAYWIRPNKFDVDQVVLRIERQLDSVQTDHIDYGYRITGDYGIDYRYFTAGGWFSDQLYKHNALYGWDPTEVYFDVYFPGVAQGMIVRVGRWIACPDIETQFAPDNYMGSHSLLFTYDTYTQTGVMFTFKLSDQWMLQAAAHAGTDMAPWYKGSLLTGAFGVRWVSKSNNDAFYTWLNAINSAEFRRFQQYGQPLGHDNFNYLVSTWEHRFNRLFITKTESYIMWQRNAVVGGSPSVGPLEPFGGGGGIGADIPGTTLTYGVLNYTTIEISKKDFITIRNEWWKDTNGERSGFPSTYTSNAIGLSHNFTPYLQIRPEIDYFRSWTVPAFDLGTRKNQFFAAFDVTLRF